MPHDAYPPTFAQSGEVSRTALTVAVHDFSGHPFQVQLSRRPAGLGHTVRHTYCDHYVSSKGALAVGPDDPPSLTIGPVHGSSRFDNYDPVRRTRFLPMGATSCVR